MTNKIRFGVIGCSNIANNSIIPAIKSSSIAELTIVGSRSIAKAKSYAEKFHCESFGSYEDVLSSAVDVIYISLPNSLHEKWVVEAAKSGKHVLCEKPSTTSLESAKKMVAECKNNEVRLMEAFMFRFHPQHNKVQELITSGRLGSVISLQGIYGFAMPSDDNIRFNKYLGGGVLNDAGCYPICASRMVFKAEPLEISCNLDVDEKSGVDTRCTAMLIYPGNRVATMCVGYGMFYQSTYSIWGTGGMLSLNRAYNVPIDMSTTITLNYGNNNEMFSSAPVNQYLLMVDEFCKELQSCGATFNFEDDLIKQARAMEAARISHSERRTVKLNDLAS